MAARRVSFEAAAAAAETHARQNAAAEYHRLEQAYPGGDATHTMMVNAHLADAGAAYPALNRYSNIVPYDRHRFKLTPDARFEGHERYPYINATLLEYPPDLGSHRYIMSMGPMHPDYFGEDTTPRFWQMVYESKAPAIVMLASVKQGFSGCSRYFPTATGEVIDCDGWVVTMAGRVEPDPAVAAMVKPPYSFLKLVIQAPASTGGGTHELIHCKYNNWPNYGVPEDAAEFAKFALHVDRFRELANQATVGAAADTGAAANGTTAPAAAAAAAATATAEAPLLVHCSGGVGRSGAFIASHCAWRFTCSNMDADGGPQVSLHPHAAVIREQRHPWSIEGEHQYAFAYSVLKEMFSLTDVEAEAEDSD